MTNNQRLLIYTFRTFPWIHELETQFGEVFVFGKLKEDLIKFEKLISRIEPKLILGAAKSNHKFSHFKREAVNRFGKGKILPNCPESINLFVPDLTGTSFKICQNPGNTFCNWVMYRVGLIIKDKNCRQMFCHTAEKDIEKISQIIKQ